MPESGNPFPGLTHDRKLTDEELAPDEVKFYEEGAEEVEKIIKETG